MNMVTVMLLGNYWKRFFVLLLLTLLLPDSVSVFGSSAVSASVRNIPLQASAKAKGDFYFFPGPVTVLELQRQLENEAGNPSLHVSVISFSGKRRAKGYVCTGDSVLTVTAAGIKASDVTAVIPGDLTRYGKSTADGCTLLYRYLSGQSELADDQCAAADLNRNGKADTADLLLLKKLASRLDSLKITG